MRCPICKTPIQSWKLMCPTHWALVPSALQAKILHSFRHGQYLTGGRERHMRMCLEAVKAVRDRPLQLPANTKTPYRDD